MPGSAGAPPRRRNAFGWGYEDAAFGPERVAALGHLLAARFGVTPATPTALPRVDDLALPAPRCAPPAALADRCAADPHARALHAYGRSYRDVVRARRGEFPNPPDLVAYPRDAAEVAAVLDWCSGRGIAVVPFGGGSSVVGGVEPPPRERWPAAVSLDLGALRRVVEVDATSRAARIEAGVLGPDLEEQLRPHGVTLRHFPQSFECSSLGGWLVTRSGGHFATLHTHIDEFVESLTVVTPAGVLATRRLPASGAGPSPERLLLGSEGILGVVVEAWMRVQPRPRFRASATASFDGFAAGAAAAGALAQSGLHPANCRLLDAGEAMLSGAGAGDAALLLVAFESADHPLDAWMQRALELVRDHGGRVPPGAGVTRVDDAGERDGAAGAWRRTFLDAPYLRDAVVGLGMLTETFETAVTWDRFATFHAGVLAAAQDAVTRVCGAGVVTCRLTHVYPDGAAPYYTVVAPAGRGGELAQWAAIKAAASDAILRLGGTITHHHAVGRDHRRWYDAERPPLFAAALQAAKAVVDPAGVLNPGVLLDARA